MTCLCSCGRWHNIKIASLGRCGSGHSISTVCLALRILMAGGSWHRRHTPHLQQLDGQNLQLRQLEQEQCGIHLTCSSLMARLCSCGSWNRSSAAYTSPANKQLDGQILQLRQLEQEQWGIHLTCSRLVARL